MSQKAASLWVSDKGRAIKIGRVSYPEIQATDVVRFGDLILYSDGKISRCSKGSIAALLVTISYESAKQGHQVKGIFRKPKPVTTTAKTNTDTQRLNFLVRHELCVEEWLREGNKKFFGVYEDGDLQIAEGTSARKAIDNAMAAMKAKKATAD